MHRYGGIWLDTDVEAIGSFNSLLPNGLFAGFENPGSICIAVLGAEKGHPVTGKMLDAYNSGEIRFSLDMNNINSSRLFSAQLRRDYQFHDGDQPQSLRDGIVLFPKEYFFPFSWLDLQKPGFDSRSFITDKTVCAHWWNISWSRPMTFRELLYLLKNDRRHFIMKFGAYQKGKLRLPGREKKKRQLKQYGLIKAHINRMVPA